MGYWQQLKNILPSFFYAASMGIVVYFLLMFVESYVLKLIVGFLIGVLYYFIISEITKSSEWDYLKRLFKDKVLIILKKSQ